MRKLILLILFALISMQSVVHGQVVRIVDVSTSGTLSTLLGVEKNQITDLTVTGILNAQDFQTIREMQAILNLDLANAYCVDSLLPNNAFERKTLNLLKLPLTIERIESNAFKGSNIGDLTIPSGLKCIGAWAFAESKFRSINFSDVELEFIDDCAFCKTQIETGVLDFSRTQNLKKFGWGVFSGFKQKVILPSNLERLERGFSGFQGEVIFPSTLHYIGTGAF
ncbi:MAG: leucine-rich repeat domain-containing protein, partial [Dysgonomonas sp.]